MSATTDTPNLEGATIEWIDRFAPYGVITTDRDLRVRGWNDWMRSHSERSLEAVRGKKLTELFPELENKRVGRPLERALLGEVSVLSSALHNYLIPLPSGIRETEFAHMKQTARVGPLISGSQIVGVIIVLEDVTQREWQAEILRRQHARDEMLSWALAHLFKAHDPRRVVRDLFCKVAEHLDFDSYLLYLREPDESKFKLFAAGGLTPEAHNTIEQIGAEKIPWVAEAKECRALIRDQKQIETDPAFETAKRLGFRAYVVLPLVTSANHLGFLCFATRTRDAITLAEAELLETISQYLAEALNREKTDRELRAAQKKLNEHAQELERNVTERTASLKQIIAELQTFSYTIAHDLRAPIRAVKGYCEVLVEDFSDHLPDAAGSVIMKLQRASLQMDALTRDLLEFSKVSRQEITLNPVDMDELIGDLVAVRGPRVGESVSVQKPLHTVLANRTLVGQCVSNLIDNALKFSRPGIAPAVRISSEIVAHTDATSETSHFSRSQYSLFEPAAANYAADHKGLNQLTRIRLWIEDNGIGISPEAQGKIFGIFERGERAGEYEGTGIGLAIVARAMERMGGACGVECNPGSGSRFWLEFRSA